MKENQAENTGQKSPYKHEITLGDIAQLVIGIISITIAVIVSLSRIKNVIIQQTEEISKGITKIIDSARPNLLCKKGKIYTFDNNKSSFKIVDIYPKNKKVKVQFNIRGKIVDEVVIANKSRIINTEKNKEYFFILLDISEKGDVAKFVVTKK